VNAYLGGTLEQKFTVWEALANLLAVLRAQAFSYQTSHWQIGGHDAYGNHLLFQRLYEGLGVQIDELAEKMVGYLGSDAVEGTDSAQRVFEKVAEWTEIMCPFRQGLQSEDDCQAAIQDAYDTIKAEGKMTLGLDDWLMATANAHETATYLLQQALANASHGEAHVALPEEFTAKTASRIRRLWLVTDPSESSEITDIASEVSINDLANISRGTPPGTPKKENWALHDSAASAISDALMRMMKLWKGKGEIPPHVFQSVGGVEGLKSWKPSRIAAAAPAAPSREDHFFDNPEKREVREFAETDATTNIPDVAEDAGKEQDLSRREVKKEVQEAEAAPPTPAEIKEEPGGKELSTLNRFVVQTEDPVPGVPESHEEVPKHPDLKASVIPQVQSLLSGWFDPK